MEEEVKKWLEKKRMEMGQPAHEREEKPVAEQKIEPQPEPEQPLAPTETAPTQTAPASITEEPEEIEESPETKHVETQNKIASDMDVLRMKDMPARAGKLFTTKAKIMLLLIIALAIFIIYWTFVFSPALLTT